MLRQAAGEEVDARLLWRLPVHLFGIHVQVLRYDGHDTRDARMPTPKDRRRQRADLGEVGDVSLAEGHVFGLLHDVSVNDKNVGELRGEAQLDPSAAVEVQAHALGKLWESFRKKQQQKKQSFLYFRLAAVKPGQRS